MNAQNTIFSTHTEIIEQGQFKTFQLESRESITIIHRLYYHIHLHQVSVAHGSRLLTQLKKYQIQWIQVNI